MEFTGNSVLAIASMAISAAIGLPAWSLLSLTLAASVSRKKNPAATASTSPAADAVTPAQPRTVVLVPAHNESVHLLPTLQCLKAQLGPHDRLLVIADNCNDDTAGVAAYAGAEVLERHNPSLRGKGYALAFGVESLRSTPPDVLVIIDADCEVSTNGIQTLAAECHNAQKPVQMLDLMVAPEGAGLRTRMLEFAWAVKNHVRPLGSQALGGACHLMGTGMALPWALAAKAELATGHIAEDMKLGVDLAIAGHPTRFITNARVTSSFPLDAAVARSQKSRWEHGHLATLKEELPRLLSAWLQQPRKPTLVLAMDLLIPPLALYFMCVMACVLALGGMALLTPSVLPALWLALASACALLGAVMLSWLGFARQLLSLRELLTVPLYAVWKLPVYLAYFMNRKSGWTKTTRKV